MSFYRGMTCENVTIKGHNGDPITAYVAKPAGAGPFPGVVLIHHLPGWSELYIETTRRFDMQAQPQLVLLQKTMVVVEGVARSLDPDFDIWEAARPVAERWVAEHVGPEARLRDAGRRHRSRPPEIGRAHV